MKFLIVTQKIGLNDDLLGFFHGWIGEFAKHAEKITVIALGVGEYSLPDNVKILSLGKERGNSKLSYFFNFYRYIWQYRHDYDAVFVHMNKEYVILGGIFWRLAGKKIGLWYQHKKVSLWLKLAELLCHVIFTASEESFKLASEKVKYVGHGIDLKNFSGAAKRPAGDGFKIIYLGRISEIKNQKLLVEAMNILINIRRAGNISAELIGAPVTAEDKIYLSELEQLVEKYGLEKNINFAGSAPNLKIAGYLASADLSVNLCPTGGMDKAVLESLIAGVPAVALNKIFADIFRGYEKYLILQNAEAGELAEKILNFARIEENEKIKIKENLKALAGERYNLEKLIVKIASNY